MSKNNDGDARVSADSAGATADNQTSFTEHGDKRAAAHTFESRTVDSDIGQTEGWSTNLKRIVDDYAQFVARVHMNDLRATDNMQRILEQDWAARLADERTASNSYRNAMANGWNNLTDEQKRVMGSETRHVDLAVDRQWNIDEHNQLAVAALREIMQSGTNNEALIVAAIKAVFDGVGAKK